VVPWGSATMAISTSLPFGIRQRPGSPGRHLPSPLSAFVTQTLARADAAVAEPFVGITTDGQPVRGLFSVQQTGVSTRPLKDAADTFLAALDQDQRTAASFALHDSAWQRWNNTHPFIMRHGVLLETLSAAQRELALALLQASLSGRGFETARNVMRLNETIGELTQHWDEYGEWLYWLSIFGTPSLDEAWGFQVDGHHLNLNCLVLGEQIVLTPAFLGSEPTLAASGKYAGTRVFEAEEQQALAFMRGLSETQHQAAIVYGSNLPGDMPEGRAHPTEGRIQGGALRDNLLLPYEGLAAQRLARSQQDALLELIEVYVGRLRAGHDKIKMAEVKEHLDQTHVAWFGGTADDSTFYYRIHSPVLLIEFDHLRGIALDNDLPARTHIHTVVRTPNGNDYGKDLLRQHYARAHSHPQA
jgi:hypothetical protein